jgi:protein SCO1/2
LKKIFFFLVGCLLSLGGFGTTVANGLEKPGEELVEAGLALRQGEKVDLDLVFTNSKGERVRFGDLFAPRRPVVLIPAYYHCPRLCGLVLDGAVKLLNELEFALGEDYQVVTLSFDSTEGPELAEKIAQKYRGKFKTPDDAARGWHFLVGEPAPIRTLMESVGFRFREDKGEFAHSAALILLTPQGEISQYFTGVSYSPRDFRLALVDASKGAIGSILDQVYLFCFRYDHLQGKYTWAVFNVVRAVGFATLAALAFLFVRLRRREKVVATAV